jgi:ABC-type oligopeptide transport system ATPase subunit
MSALLKVERLSVTYPGPRAHILAPRTPRQVVRDVSFTIARGETFGLIGESGSGKSTIGKALLRLVTPSGGSIEFDGMKVTGFGRRTPIEFRRRVQCVYQDPFSSLNPRQTIGRSLDEALRCHTALDARGRALRVRGLLDDVGLPAHHSSKYPGELSGGQQQRVAIARALSTNPDLIVCDEAVSALDVSTQGQVLNLLQDLQQEHGLSYLFITHDLSVVRYVSSRIGIIRGGQLLEVGETAEIFRNPSTEYTRSLLEAIPRITR